MRVTGGDGPDAERGPWGAPCDVVMNDKKPTFGLHPVSVSGTEPLKRLVFPECNKGDKGVLIFVTSIFQPQLVIIR